MHCGKYIKKQTKQPWKKSHHFFAEKDKLFILYSAGNSESHLEHEVSISLQTKDKRVTFQSGYWLGWLLYDSLCRV